MVDRYIFVSGCDVGHFDFQSFFMLVLERCKAWLQIISYNISKHFLKTFHFT